MNIELLDIKGKKVSDFEVSDELFGGEVNEGLFYEVVKMQLANRRVGSANTKTRSEVSGGGVKPWRQKGTGRARSGSNRSPIWRHGGTTFGPKPRDYSYKVPKKVLAAALKSAIALRAQEGTLKVFDSIELADPKTKLAIDFLGSAGLENVLIVIDGENRNLSLGVRNLQGCKVIDASGLNVYDVLNHSNLAMTAAAYEKVVARVSK